MRTWVTVTVLGWPDQAVQALRRRGDACAVVTPSGSSPARPSSSSENDPVPVRCTSAALDSPSGVGASGGMYVVPSSPVIATASMASARSRRCTSGSMPIAICASSHVRECTPSFGFRKCEQGLAKPLPTISGIHRDIGNTKSFVSHSEDNYAHNGLVAFSNGCLIVLNDLCIIVSHRARQHPNPLNIVPICGINECRHFLDIRLSCGAK